MNVYLLHFLQREWLKDLTDYLKEFGLKVAYLHSETKTLKRTEILKRFV